MEIKDVIKRIDKNDNTMHAVFRDSKGSFNIADIYINDVVINIDTRNMENQETGYMHLFFHPEKRFFLDEIYCYDQFRGRSIASNISQLSDFLLKNYNGHIIRGVYKPGQLSIDRLNNIVRDKKELENRADSFYYLNGYTKITLEEFRKCPEKYPKLTERLDFELGEETARCIVVKEVKQKEKYPFEIINGIIINKNALEKEMER